MQSLYYWKQKEAEEKAKEAELEAKRQKAAEEQAKREQKSNTRNPRMNQQSHHKAGGVKISDDDLEELLEEFS